MPEKEKSIWEGLPEADKQRFLEAVFRDIREELEHGENKKCTPSSPKSQCAQL